MASDWMAQFVATRKKYFSHLLPGEGLSFSKLTYNGMTVVFPRCVGKRARVSMATHPWKRDVLCQVLPVSPK